MATRDKAWRLCVLLLLVGGCTYPAPFSRRLTDERKAQMIAVEKCCRANKAKIWDGYLHSTDT